MSSFYTIKQRLARLEQRVNPAPRVGKLAASGFFETEMGRALLETTPPEQHATLCSQDGLYCDDWARICAHPVIQAEAEARLSAWRKARGFEGRGKEGLQRYL